MVVAASLTGVLGQVLGLLIVSIGFLVEWRALIVLLVFERDDDFIALRI